MPVVIATDGKKYDIPQTILDKHLFLQPQHSEEVSLAGGEFLVQVFYFGDQNEAPSRKH